MSPEDLARVAARFSRGRAFVGWALARYAESEGVDAAALRRILNASETAYHRLCLCLRPRPDYFAGDVREIAAGIGVDAGVLAEVARRADVLEHLGADAAASSADSAGILLAARARPRGPKGKS